jgi:hypothetical protein
MKAKLLTLAGLCSLAVALAVPASGAAATAPTVQHFHFTTDPYDTNVCGVDVIDVDTVSGMFLLSPSGATINAVDGKSVFTNPTSGKSITFMEAGAVKTSAPVDNGDGTFSVVFTGNGLTKISGLNGPPLDGIDGGSSTFLVTFDANGNVVSFDVLSIKGPHPAVGCDLITAALT